MTDIAALEARAADMYTNYFRKSEAEQTAMTEEYKTVIQPALLAHYGADALATQVDPWTAEVYSDLYKDRAGFRPRGHSYATMKSFMDSIPPLEEDEPEDRDARLEALIDTYYSFDDATEADLRDFEDVYGVSGRLFAASALRNIGAYAEEI